MERKFVRFLVILFLVSLLSLILIFNCFFYDNLLTGQVTSGVVNFTKVGSAGMVLSEDLISFGSGYYNGSCSVDYAVLNSNTSRNCWVNVSPVNEDFHEIYNSGTTTLNVTVSASNYVDAEEFFCNVSQGCIVSSSSKVFLSSFNDESDSCGGLTDNFEVLLTDVSNKTVGICDSLNYADNSDSIKIYVALYVPKDSSVGNKTLILNYEGIAL